MADLLLVDGKNMWHRCAYGSSPKGPIYTEEDERKKNDPAGLTIHGFIAALLRVTRDHGGLPVVCWEGERNWRFGVYPAYKGNRRPYTEDADQDIIDFYEWRRQRLEHGLEKMCELLRLLGVRQCGIVDGEADDAIATIATALSKRGRSIDVYSGDHDLFQLVAPRVRVICPGWKGAETVYSKDDHVKKKLGVTAAQVTSFKAIAGDSSDNIPGVKGLGPKAAEAILERYGTLKGALRNLDEWDLRESWATKLREEEDDVRMFLNLVTLRRSSKLTHVKGEPDRAAALHIMRKLGMRELAKAGAMYRISTRLAA